jgi:sigma-E factor negative regulatory protein RseB
VNRTYPAKNRGRPGRLFYPGLLAAICLAAQGAWAQQCPGADKQALEWLDKMSRSVNQVSYHGVVTYQRGDEDMQVLQISHSVADGTTSERMTQLTGQGAQVVRRDHPLDCLHPGHKLLRLSEDLRAGQCGIAENYRFSVSDGDRVAGRKAVRVRIEPRDVYRFGYVMELDRSTALLLKTATIGRGSKVLEKFQFANLSYDEQPVGNTEIDVTHQAAHPMPGSTEPRGSLSRAWGVAWLPRGFTVTDGQLPNGGRKTYTDGLAVFSVFVEELDREIRPGEGVVRDGSTTSYTRGKRVSEQPVLITVVGEVPVNTARMVADSVNWVR